MKRKVLIVEDEPIVALDLHEEVEQLGCEVVGIAESAEHAMSIAEIYRPDLALMDINILGCMDGIQTAKLLRGTYRIPSIFLTSYCDDATMRRAVQDMTYGYLTKPYKSQQLKAALMVAIRLIESEEAALEEQGQVTAAVRCMCEGLLTVALDGSVQFMNAAAEKVTGILPRHAYGKQLTELLALGDDFQVEQIQSLGHAKGAIATTVRTLEIIDRNSNPVELSFASMFDNDGKLTGYAITMHDLRGALSADAVVMNHG